MLPSLSSSGLLKNLNSLNAGGGTLKIGNYGIQLPTLNMFTSAAEPIMGFGDFTSSAGSIVQLLTRGARAVYCIGALLTSPTQMLAMLKMVGQYVLMLGFKIINEIYQNCVARINSILANVYGIILSYYRTIKHLIKSIQGAVDLFKKLISEKKLRASNIWAKIFERENCEFFIANLLRCLIAKWIEPYITKFVDKVNQKIDNIAGEATDKINEITAVPNAMSTYLDNQATFVDKFTAQVGAVL